MKIIPFFLTSLMACAAAFAQSGPVFKPADFAARFDIITTSAEPFQRLPLRPEVFRYSQSAQLNDIRVFNAGGESLPFALRQPNERSAPQEAAQGVAVYPVQASVHAAALGGGRMEVRQNAGGTTVVIEGLDAAAQPESETRVDAYLLDTRAIKTRAVALELDADFDNAKLVPISVEASSDLKTWRWLATAEPVYRLGNSDTIATHTTVRFANASSVENQFLRIIWSNTARFTLHAALLKTIVADPAPLVADVTVPVGGPVAFDGRTAEWSVPTPVSLTQFEVKLAEPNTLVPVKIFGRKRAGETWLAIGRGVIYRIAREGGESLSPPLAVNSGSYQALKIEVDGAAGSLGSTPPEAVLRFAPREVVFLTRGPELLTLVTGHSSASAAQLPLQRLIPGYKTDAEQAFPQAALAHPVINDSLLAKPAKTLLGIDLRRLVLWGILIAAVLLLSVCAVSLLRKLNKAQANRPERV
jgi:hypothetical protein